MEINNFYNFKNSIRYFIDISHVKFPFENDKITINELAWSEPINFRIRKENNKYRILKIPNILNFICAYEKFKNYKHFTNPSEMDKHKRLVPNLKTGDFATGVYDLRLEDDFQLLCVYDNLIKLDIKSYYGRIYTHNIEFENAGDENFLTNLNLGNTNGLIMSNYISLYCAEKYSKKISDDIQNKLEKCNIDCEFSYFSDDFYFFCNKEDNEKVIGVFDKVLENYDLERNNSKIELWEYIEYNNYNLMEKYWKKIIAESKNRFDKNKKDNNLYFLNQLIYRISQLKDEKQQKTFIITFFKSTYFSKIDIEKYKIEDYNFHQICYMIKICPEIILYVIDKLKVFDCFKESKFKKFLEVRYKKSLKKSYNEEQLYFYYAIKILGFELILDEMEDIVVESNNQILISYYLKDKKFKEENINKLKLKSNEKYWFQNYHLILFSDLIYENIEENIKKFLMPEWIKNNPTGKKQINIKQNTYINFYEDNLKSEISIVKDVFEMKEVLEKYIDEKIEERVDIFGIENY